MHVEESSLKAWCLLDAVKGVKEALPSIPYLGLTELEDMVSMEYEEETALFCVRTNNAFIFQKNAVVFVRPS